MTLSDVRVWKDNRTGEGRVYVHTTDNREGCKYVTGSKWNKAGTITGKLTEEEWAEARRVAIVDGKWNTWYAPRKNETSRNHRCEECGAIMNGAVCICGNHW